MRYFTIFLVYLIFCITTFLLAVSLIGWVVLAENKWFDFFNNLITSLNEENK